MQRRAVLRSLSATAAIGLAGCPLGDSSEPQCGTPGENLEGALPSSGKYSNPTVDANNTAEEVSGATRHVLASYRTEEGNYLFVIGEYASDDAAREAGSDEETWSSYGDDIVGALVVDTYVYVVMGPDQEGVRELMAAADPLNEACVEENITIL